MDTKEEKAAAVNRRALIYRGRVFRLVRENVTLTNGATADLDYIEHPGAAAIVPLASPGEVVLVRQYRHALKRYIWEIPAGTLDPGESGLACARRELAEETGYSAARWHSLAEITPVPGYSDERVFLFLATELSPVQQGLDADEVLEVHRLPLAKAIERIARGEIQDAKSICGLLLAATHPSAGG
ncbi:MAG: NUDIX hydrolase [Desulfobacterales bacterium]|jgi:ADP-ribose pyrophosphatase|nr:NUDIX hydrolase [Desulfobacterales bacterium]